MSTRFIGVKEFRQNMARITAHAKKRKERIILLRNNEPIFELLPLSKKDAAFARLKNELKKARRAVRSNKIYTLKQVEKILNL